MIWISIVRSLKGCVVIVVVMVVAMLTTSEASVRSALWSTVEGSTGRDDAIERSTAE